jgi:hypothetical protein
MNRSARTGKACIILSPTRFIAPSAAMLAMMGLMNNSSRTNADPIDALAVRRSVLPESGVHLMNAS